MNDKLPTIIICPPGIARGAEMETGFRRPAGQSVNRFSTLPYIEGFIVSENAPKRAGVWGSKEKSKRGGRQAHRFGITRKAEKKS